MAIENLPEFIRENYEVHEWKHASAILESDSLMPQFSVGIILPIMYEFIF
jgi:hypothetical protein